MKQQDFDEVNKFCEEKGFLLLNSSKDDNDSFFVIKRKDPWKGVEFAVCPEVNSLIKKTIKTDDKYGEPTLHFSNGDDFIRSLCKHSTEQSYVEQLKKEAHERFGEIRYGDLFDRSALLDFKDTKRIGNCYGFEGFRYYKENDGLDFNGTCIYQQGKWAERVKERVKVDHVGVDYSTWSGNVFFGFSFKGSQDIDKSGIGSFLASQLEKYLNGEIE